MEGFDQDLVIGSGPAGVAATMALLERGRRVTMIDFGTRIEPEAAAIPAPAAGKPFEEWPVSLRSALASIEGPMEDGLPMKTNFGSDFATRREPDFMPLEIRGAQILLSLARGGLSNLWGANAFPFCADDFTGWPIGEVELREGYRAALRHVPLSAQRDEVFDREFPLHTDRLEPRPLSRQALEMLRELEAHRDTLRARGVRFGPSRLAMRVNASGRDPGCVRCGFCLHGCPHDLIYSSSQTLATLQRDPRLTYAGGHYAVRFSESADGVEVDTLHAPDRTPVRFRGRRLFVAAGGYSTPRLVMESRDQYSGGVIMLESQYFLIPVLQRRAFSDLARERLTTLSQLCLRMRDPGFGPRDVHLLLYTYNPLYRKVVGRTPARWIPGLTNALVARLGSLQGYLHSDVSPRFALSLRRNAGGAATLVVEGRERPESARIVRRVEARVRELSGAIGAMPVPFMTKIGAPGKSYHSGGTFPMRRSPGPDDSDLLGRPAGASRVHLVDASVFPAIPGTNMTLTLMANAYRIAAESATLDAAATGAAGAGA